MHRRSLAALFVVVLSGLLAATGLQAQTQSAAASPASRVQYKIVTASERGTYIQIGRDIAKFIAPAASIDLEVLPSAGSAENVERLRFEPGVKLAMVQSDVYQAFLDLAAGGNAEAGRMIRPLRVIMPLYNEEIYFIARADSPLNFVHEIKDAKINVGALRSGTAMSATTLYRQMFAAAIPEGSASYLSNEEALVKLIDDKTIDVVVVVAGQPAKLLVDMKPEARQLIKLLKFDPNNAAGKAAFKTYFPATVRAASYPNLLAEDVPGGRGQGVPRHLRLQARLHQQPPGRLRALAVPELRPAAGPGPFEVARSRSAPAGTRPGLVVLAAHASARCVPAAQQSFPPKPGRRAPAHSRNASSACASDVQTSMFAARSALVSMKSRRGSTSSPISIVNTRSASIASSICTCSRRRTAGSIVVSHSCAGFISPRPL